jgi:ABC-type histidine transport system ATPase subunit
VTGFGGRVGKSIASLPSSRRATLSAPARVSKTTGASFRRATATHGHRSVLAMDPQLMLFDEATSALDPELVGEVLTAMRRLAEDGMTMLIVTHELGFAYNVADRIVFLHDGQIHEEGPPADVLGQPSRIRTREFLRSHTLFPMPDPR